MITWVNVVICMHRRQAAASVRNEVASQNFDEETGK